MKLRKKIVLISILTAFCLSAILFLISNIIVINRSNRLENENMQENLKRSLNAFNGRLAEIDTFTADWAAWDDTYAFVQDRNEEYINSNLVEATFTNANLNLIAYADSSGELIFIKLYDSNRLEEVPLSSSIYEHLSNDAIITHSSTESGYIGIIPLSETPLMFVSRPILTSDSEGPIRGTLVMAQYLDTEMVDNLSNTTNLDITIQPLDNSQIPADTSEVIRSLSADDPFFIQQVSSKLTTGYALLNDIYGEPYLAIQVSMPREIYAESMQTIVWMHSGFMLFVLVFLLLNTRLTEKFILSRLQRLSVRISKIGSSSDLSLRVPVEGHDELSSLAEEVNITLEKLAATRNELQNSEKRYASLIEQSNDGIIIIEDSFISYVNPMIQELSGFSMSMKELLEKPFMDFVCPEYQNIVPDNYKARMKGNPAPERYEIEILHKDGSSIPVEIAPKVIELDGKLCEMVVIRDLRERKEAIERLKESERYLRILLDSFAAGAFIIDPETHRIIDVNTTAAKIIGTGKNKIVGQICHKFVCTADVGHCPITAFGQTINVSEQSVINIKGEQIPILKSVIPIESQGQKYLFESFIDITDRKKAEEALRESQEFNNSLLENAPNAVVVINPDTSIRYVNPAWVEINGWTLDEVVGIKAPYPWWLEEQREESIDAFKIAMEQDSGHDEVIAQKKNGERYWIALNWSAIKHNGELMYLLINSVDITESKQMEEALRQNEEKLRLMFDAAGEGIVVIDLDNKILDVNQAIVRMHGYDSREELIGRNALDLSSEEDHSRAMNNTRKRLDENLIGAIEYTLVRKDGSKFPALVNMSSIRDDNGSPIGYIGIFADITERKKAEAALKEQKEFIDRILSSTPNSVAVLNDNLQILLVNRAFEDMFKVKRSNIEGKQIVEVMNIEELTEAISDLPVNNETGFSKEYVYKSSETNRILTIQAIPMRDKEILLLISDVTEEWDRQERLYLTDRLASVGEMASGVAHELNNPLTSVIGLSQLLVDEDLPEETKEDVQAIYSEAQRAAVIIRNLLTFARKHAPLRELTQINKIVEDVLMLRAYEHRVNNIKIDKRFDQNLPEITVDYFQMQQVFLNIVLNAENVMIEAHKQGTLTVNTERVNGTIRVSFIDDGPGIPSENLIRIFDPFFTTKEVGKGTGLGLSICYGIVTNHGGKIYAKNNPSKGASFIVELPIKN